MIKEIMHHKEVIEMEKITNCVECEELRVKGKTHQDMWCGKEDKKIVQRSNCDEDYDDDYDEDYEECDECGENYNDCDCE